ncbi:MAG: VOC family protein [Paracoccaceae bacterium]
MLTVTDVAQAVTFYSDCLGMRPEAFCAADGSERWR